MNLQVTERPQRFRDVVGQEAAVANVWNQSRKNRFSSSYILEGHFGCGKTTTARIMALAANCENVVDGEPCCQCESCKSILDGSTLDVIELNAAKESRKDEVTSAIIDGATYLPTGRKKVFILDECHALASGAWGALLKVIEEPPEHCMFLFCTTNAEKIPNTIVSRSLVLKFQAISEEDIGKALIKTCKEKGFSSVTEDMCKQIAHQSNGAMRDAMKILGNLMDSEEVNEAALSKLLAGDIGEENQTLALSLLSGDKEGVVKSLNSLRKHGVTDWENFFKKQGRFMTDAIDVKFSDCRGIMTEQYLTLLKPIAACSVERIAQVCNMLFDLGAKLHINNTFSIAQIVALTIAVEIKETKVQTEQVAVSIDKDTFENLVKRVTKLERMVKDMETKLETVNANNVTAGSAEAFVQTGNAKTSSDVSVSVPVVAPVVTPIVAPVVAPVVAPTVAPSVSVGTSPKVASIGFFSDYLDDDEEESFATVPTGKLSVSSVQTDDPMDEPKAVVTSQAGRKDLTAPVTDEELFDWANASF